MVDHPKYRGRKIFSAGINLTHLYHGKIPYLWYIRRDMGFVNKMLRGLAMDAASPDEVYGGTARSPGSQASTYFAIGGGCQYLLAMDYVVAGSDAYMTLPARKEGIIPGAANLAAAALRRRPHRAAGDLDGAPARLRHAGRPHDLRRDRAARRDGRGDRARGRRFHRLGRGQRRRQPARDSRWQRSRSTRFAATWRSMRASRRIAISARR